MTTVQVTPSNRESFIIWQNNPDGVGEPALLIETYNDVFSITQEDRFIQINYSTVKELCRIMKQLKEPE